MSRHDQHRDVDLTRTRLGMGDPEDPGGPLPVDDQPPVGRFRARIGRTGQVFEADSGHPGRQVLKLFPWAAGLPPAAVQDFTREARSVANLRHPHVAQLIEAGMFADGTPFVIMERLPAGGAAWRAGRAGRG
jgi:hypothetical protein